MAEVQEDEAGPEVPEQKEPEAPKPKKRRKGEKKRKEKQKEKEKEKPSGLRKPPRTQSLLCQLDESGVLRCGGCGYLVRPQQGGDRLRWRCLSPHCRRWYSAVDNNYPQVRRDKCEIK